MNATSAGSQRDPEEFLAKFLEGLQDSRVEEDGNYALYGRLSDNIATKVVTGVLKV